MVFDLGGPFEKGPDLKPSFQGPIFSKKLKPLKPPSPATLVLAMKGPPATNASLKLMIL